MWAMRGQRQTMLQWNVLGQRVNMAQESGSVSYIEEFAQQLGICETGWKMSLGDSLCYRYKICLMDSYTELRSIP